MSERMSASVVGRQLACHASANLDKAIPNWTPPVEDRTANNAANRGTDMHEILAKAGELSTRDMNMLTEAMAYVAILRRGRRFKVLNEVKMQATWLQASPTTTADVVLYTQDEIHLVDYKTGKIHVEVEENEQLLFGAATYGHLAPKAKGVMLHIVQPWADNCESWFADTNRIKQFMTDCLAAETAIAAGDTTFGPSDKCQFCPANPHSRGAKGKPLCPVMMQVYGYTGRVDEDAILAL